MPKGVYVGAVTGSSNQWTNASGVKQWQTPVAIGDVTVNLRCEGLFEDDKVVICGDLRRGKENWFFADGAQIISGAIGGEPVTFERLGRFLRTALTGPVGNPSK